MLLTRLVEYANMSPDVMPPFYAPKAVRWVVELAADGSPSSWKLTPLADPSDRATRNGVVRNVPSVQRSGTAPNPMLAVDTAEYALGWATDESRAVKALGYHAAFLELVRRWHEAEPTPEVMALLSFLDSARVAALARPDDLAGNHLVAFRCGGVFVHETEEARRFWAAEAGGRKGSGRTGLCLVCGRIERLLQTIPQQLPTRLVPGASNNASLVSFNKPTHGFDLQEQLAHTPICVTCGLQAMNALEALLSGSTSSMMPGQDARLAWWVTGGVPFDMGSLDDPQPQRVASLLGSPAGGRAESARTDDDLSVFCALAVGGNIARVVVREWIEQPLPRIRANLRRWFDDHEIADAWTGEVRPAALSRLTLATGRWVAGRGRGGGRGTYVPYGSPGADRPGGVHRALLATALLDKPLPARLLAHLVHRVRTDGRLDTERAALIRLALIRSARQGRPGYLDPESYMPTLSPHNHQPAYLAGRIFAVIEDIQRSAGRARGDSALNVTFTDRYFARAVTSPAVALVAGQRDAQAWLRRMRRFQPGWAAAAEQRLDELFAQIADAGGIPHGAVLADQAAFILGYHQERAATRGQRAAASPQTGRPKDDGPTDPADLDSHLKGASA